MDLNLNNKIKVLIVEDEPLIARDIQKHLASINYETIGIAYRSENALDMLATRQPDIAILDINIKGSMDGIDIANVINTKHHIPFIYLTSYADKNTLERAKPTLPYGYILKPFDEKDLLTSIEMAVYKHQKNYNSSIFSLNKINAHFDKSISEREFEIILDIMDGITIQQMAAKHFLSENTIKMHIRRIYGKLNTHSRAETTKLLLSL